MINISKLWCGLAGESDDLRYEQSKSHGPVVVYNCTESCNLRCLHCYSSSPAHIGGPHLDVSPPQPGREPKLDTSGSDQLTTAQAKQFLPQLAEANRKDLFELLAEAKRLGLRTVISTNGTLIDSATAQKLADLGVHYVGISLDGEEKFHDKFRQIQGCFKAAVAGIEHCKKADIKTGLRFTITKANAEQVPFVFDIAASTGVRRICFYHLIRMGRAKDLDEQAVIPEQTRRVLDVIIERTDDSANKGLIDEVLTVGNHADGPYLLVKMQSQQNQAFQKARELLLVHGGNKVGENIGCVSWNGSVYADQFWRNYSLGNIKERTFKEIWEDSTEPVLGNACAANGLSCAKATSGSWALRPTTNIGSTSRPAT
ncbi:MAG: radical SAM protein [Planctomycetota bacterium]|jgi:MoaA/NifB/PqqE/SkfB family radical SAM enzyme